MKKSKNNEYVIVDIEATCWNKYDDNIKNKQSETIEIGAVKVFCNDRQKYVLIQFQTFIKPKYNPILTDFCKDLTSITQNDVDNGIDFLNAIEQFENFIGDGVVCSWGGYDKRQLIREAKLKKYKGNLASKLSTHINIKQEFARIYNINDCGMMKALNILNIEHTGKHHRGISDANNITKIFFEIFDKL